MLVCRHFCGDLRSCLRRGCSSRSVWVVNIVDAQLVVSGWGGGTSHGGRHRRTWDLTYAFGRTTPDTGRFDSTGLRVALLAVHLVDFECSMSRRTCRPATQCEQGADTSPHHTSQRYCCCKLIHLSSGFGPAVWRLQRACDAASLPRFCPALTCADGFRMWARILLV